MNSFVYNILLVDDEREIETLFSSLFSGTCYQLFYASDKERANQILAQEPIDLILLDIQFEDYYEGLPILVTLKATYPYLPVIMVTGVPEFNPRLNGVATALKELGALEVWSKHTIGNINQRVNFLDKIKFYIQNPVTHSKSRNILFLAANARQNKILNLGIEARAIREAIKTEQNLHLSTEWAVNYGDLQDFIKSKRYNIIHLSAHGNSSGEIYFESSNHATSVSSIEGLFEILKKEVRVIECIVLNCCYTQTLAESLGKYVKYVVATNAPINDTTAIEFSSQFYHNLMSPHFDYKKAFELAVNHLNEVSPRINMQSGRAVFFCDEKTNEFSMLLYENGELIRTNTLKY